MPKTEIKTQKTEIVKQVRLTPNQRYTLVDMQTKGGRYDGHHMDWTTRATLQNLMLIEERPRFSPAEIKRATTQSIARWHQLARLVKAKNLAGLDQKIHELRDLARRADQKAWWLTKQADEYLLRGSVVIKR